ncbi:hypothetical protein G4B88_011636 [Cannabis sativa]|uniref:Zinc knuckle CX2CX4HX4C domain-containing protein n=1 Tax=Cannabis sativa TaxID=3483 RepID=A0A7J6EC47_CANSA|nr:hypothetical protein G4B88_011636 [Cannabis sativa]
MRLTKPDGTTFWANFKYERAPTFCFICGIIGHSERFCVKLFDKPLDQIVKPYGEFMRAKFQNRKQNIGAKWLRTRGWTPGAVVGESSGGPVENHMGKTNMESDNQGEEGGKNHGEKGGEKEANLNHEVDLQDFRKTNKGKNLIVDISDSQMEESATHSLDENVLILDNKRRKSTEALEKEASFKISKCGEALAEWGRGMEGNFSQRIKSCVREWDKEVLEDVLNERDKKLVLSIPLNSTRINDGCKPLAEITIEDIVGKALPPQNDWHEFYKTYSQSIGFGVRCLDVKRKLGATPHVRKWVCSKEGLRCENHAENAPLKNSKIQS